MNGCALSPETNYLINEPMDFQTNEHDDILVIKILPKRATMRIADPLREYLLLAIEEGKRKIIVDLNNVDFLDSTFLGALMAGMKRLVSLDGEIRLCTDNTNVVNVLNVTRLNRVFSLFDSVKEARDSF